MAKLVLNEAALQEYLTGRTGPVYRTVRAFAEEVAAYAKAHAPLGFDQDGRRAVGALRADMRIRDEEFLPGRINIVVGTDPVNHEGPYPYHYGYVVHQGRGGFASTRGVMKFMDRSGEWHARFEVGGAEPQPFLYDAVKAVNVSFPVKFRLIEIPTD